MAKKDIFGNMKLSGPDIFLQPDVQDTDEKIKEIELDKLFPYRNHPYSVKDDKEMDDLVESIRENGVQTPALVRPLPRGGYEILSGHRRHRASVLAGLATLPCIVREVDDDTAAICMVDANLQRENISAVEKAAAYKIKLEALRNQGKSCGMEDSELSKATLDKLAEDSQDSRTQIHRYLRINELIPELQQMVEDKQIAMNTSVPISYLTPDEQKNVADIIHEGTELTIEMAQNIKAKAESKKIGDLTEGEIRRAINTKVKQTPKKTKRSLTLDEKYLLKFFPEEVSVEEIRETITHLLQSME